MSTYSAVRDMKRKYVDSLFKKPNVVGVGVGNKIKDGIATEELCIKIYVENKQALSTLKEEEVIPTTLDNIKTDVIEVGKIRFQSLRGRNRPAQGGESISSCQSLAYGWVTAGTLGVALYDKTDGKPVILSNNHVLANCDNDTDPPKANVGDTIIQPGTLDGGSCTNDRIATLKRWVKLKITGDNYLDGAIAEVTTPTDVSLCTIDGGIGRVQGYRRLDEVDLNTTVQKCGRTTGYTTGTVLDIDATINVNYEVLTPSGIINRNIRFVDQILITSMSDHGDSGSLILDMNEKAVGLLFAGSPTVTVANHWVVVMDILALELCPITEICRLGGPHIVKCRLGGPGYIICKAGGPNFTLCPIGGPNIIKPRCLACGPDGPLMCGSGGPHNLIDVFGCSGGPDIEIRIKDPLVDPIKLAVINIDKIPPEMKKSFENMMNKMAET